jgi:SAM-dependent methyltransferase
MAVDFGRTHEDYAAYRAPFDPRLIQRLDHFGIGDRSQRILDLGGGTGLLADALEASGANVILADVSEPLLRQSSHPQRVAARAEALPFASASFDVVTCAQCWHWFDRIKAPAEVRRVLKPTGRIAVVYQTYIPLPGSVADASERLILTYRRAWRHANSTGLNGQVLRDLQISGFTAIESFSFDVEIAFSRQSWNGFLRTTSPLGASMNPDELNRFEAEHIQLLTQYAEPLLVPHRVFAVVAHTPV